MRCRNCHESYDAGAPGADPALCDRCRPPAEEVEAYRECPACAEPIRVRATICRFCGHDLRAPLPPRPGPGAAAGRVPAHLVKSPALAACLSFLYSALGQLYCGRVARGLVVMLGPIVLVLVVLFGGARAGLLLFVYVGLLVFYVWQVYDAWLCAVQANATRARSSRPSRRARGARRTHRARR